MKVKGTYFGTQYTGMTVGFWGWSDKCGRDGNDSVFVKLDTPITVNGVERKMISVGCKGTTIQAEE